MNLESKSEVDQGSRRGLSHDALRATKGEKIEKLSEAAAYQPDAGDATAVSTARGACTVGGFDGRQKLTEWAPLIFVR